MKIETDALRAALKVCAAAIAAKPDAPQLGGVELTADHIGLRLATSDYTVWITTAIAGEPDPNEAWAATVSHKLLTQIAAAAGAKSSLELHAPVDGTLRVSTGRSFWLAPLVLGNPLHFPELPAVWAEVDAATFADTCATIALGAKDEWSGTPPLDVVELAGDSAGLTLAATNRYRVHVADLSGAVPNQVLSIYPEAELLSKATAAMAGRATLHAAPGAEVFAISDGTTTVIMRTRDVGKGWVPVATWLEAWRRGERASTVVPAKDLLRAIKGAAVGMPSEHLVLITASLDGLTVRGNNKDTGAVGNIAVESFVSHDGPGLQVVINPAQLTPLLSRAGDAELVIAWTEPATAALFNVAGRPDLAFAVMPIRAAESRWLETPELVGAE